MSFYFLKEKSLCLLKALVTKRKMSSYVQDTIFTVKSRGGGGGERYFPYIFLNEIQTMFSQLAKRSAKVLPADLCADHAHYVKIHRSTVLRKNKNMAVEDGTFSHYYILVIRKFIDFMSLFRYSVWFPFSVKQLSSAEFGLCNI